MRARRLCVTFVSPPYWGRDRPASAVSLLTADTIQRDAGGCAGCWVCTFRFAEPASIMNSKWRGLPGNAIGLLTANTARARSRRLRWLQDVGLDPS